MLERDDDDYVVTRAGRHYINNVCKEFYIGDSIGEGQHAEFVPTLTANQILAFAKKREQWLAGTASEGSAR